MTAIDKSMQLGDPVEHGSVTIAPLFPRATPRAEYITLDDAIPLGLRITEVDEAGSVPELLVENPVERNVLLYDGEELLGAKQNRILNVTVLVPARGRTRIPVSCVEEGRWSRRSAEFRPARHASDPTLRRRKAEQLSAAPMARGAAQAEVWAAVADTASALDVHSPTSAHADAYRAHEVDLASLRGAFPLQPGQSGAIVAVGAAMTLDFVSRPAAFAKLYPKLLDGYLLQALGVPSRRTVALEPFLAAVAAAPASRRLSVALGEDIRLRDETVVGSGLEFDGELIQLSAFTAAGNGHATRIAPPSRRR
jgi:hypothetical protein